MLVIHCYVLLSQVYGSSMLSPSAPEQFGFYRLMTRYHCTTCPILWTNRAILALLDRVLHTVNHCRIVFIFAQNTEDRMEGKLTGEPEKCKYHESPLPSLPENKEKELITNHQSNRDPNCGTDVARARWTLLRQVKQASHFQWVCYQLTESMLHCA